MSTQAAETSVSNAIVVDAPQERAFEVFTAGIGTWFPSEYNLMDTEIVERVFEPRVGGHIYDKGANGGECHWGRVLAYEPPSRVVFSWDIGAYWQIETDPDKTSEVEVRFTPEGERTRVELEHRHLDRHGDGWEGMREGVSSPTAWPLYLERYDAALAA